MEGRDPPTSRLTLHSQEQRGRVSLRGRAVIGLLNLMNSVAAHRLVSFLWGSFAASAMLTSASGAALDHDR